MKSLKKILALVLACITVFAFSGCGGNENSPSDDSSTELENLKVLLDWTPNTNHTGLFIAREKGYYKEAGLDVEIMSADGANTLEMLATGSGDVGISFQEQLTTARVSETPLDVVAIGTILQKNTSGFASLADKNIKSAKDLEGKSYGSWGTDIETAFINSVMKKNNADASKVNIKISNALDTFSLLQNEADFAWIYYGWDGIIAKQKGIEMNYMPLEELDSDIDFYSPLLAVGRKTLDEKPEQLKKFMEATAKGYEFAAKNPEEAAEIMAKANPDTDKQIWVESQKYLSKYLLDENGKFGTMKDSVWENFTKWMLDNKIIAKQPVVKDMYTNEFLK